MKIAIDNQIFFNQKYGGISRYFVELTKIISQGPHEIKIFAPYFQNEYLADLPKFLVAGERLKLPHSKIAPYLSSFSRNSCIRKIKKWQPDVIHETYYSRKPLSHIDVPVVITVYDMIHELFPSNFSTKDQTIGDKKIAIERADKVICISHSTKNDLVALYGVDEKKIDVVHLGFKRLESKLNQKLLIPSSRPYLLFVGSRGGYKNFSRFLEAISTNARLKNNFDVIAFGDAPFSPNEMEMIKSLQFREHQIHHMGGSDSLLAHLYSNAHAFIYPSIYEGFGLPPLEAMAHKCPVIASNSSSMPEVIGNAGEYFSPHSVEGMGSAIEGVVFSESRIQELKILGESRIEEFTWEKCAQKTLSIYQSLV